MLCPVTPERRNEYADPAREPVGTSSPCAARTAADPSAENPVSYPNQSPSSDASSASRVHSPLSRVNTSADRSAPRSGPHRRTPQPRPSTRRPTGRPTHKVVTGASVSDGVRAWSLSPFTVSRSGFPSVFVSPPPELPRDYPARGPTTCMQWCGQPTSACKNAGGRGRIRNPGEGHV